MCGIKVFREMKAESITDRIMHGGNEKGRLLKMGKFLINEQNVSVMVTADKQGCNRPYLDLNIFQSGMHV